MQATGADLPERQQVIQAYLTLQRSSEEIELLKEDIKNVLNYYINIQSRILYENNSRLTMTDPISWH